MKKRKILAAIVASVVVLVLIGVVVGLNLRSNDNEVGESLSSSLVSSTIPDEEGGGKHHSNTKPPSIQSAPENSESTVDKSGATMFPGDKESTSSPSTSAKPNTSSSSSTSSSSTSSSTSSSQSSTSTSKPNSESSTSTSSSSSSSTGTSQSTSTPAPETSSSSSVAPSNPSDGHIGLTQGSTGKTSFGTEYPILSEFNNLALTSGNHWYSNDDVPDEYSNAVGEANRALGKAVGSLESTGVAITMDGTGNVISCGSAWVERQPSKGQYLFVYGCDFTALSDGGAVFREIIKAMLGMSVTSTPIEVEQALWDDCFGDYEQFDKDTWVTIGDCKIQYGGSENGVWHYVIKPAK